MFKNQNRLFSCNMAVSYWFYYKMFMLKTRRRMWKMMLWSNEDKSCREWPSTACLNSQSCSRDFFILWDGIFLVIDLIYSYTWGFSKRNLRPLRHICIHRSSVPTQWMSDQMLDLPVNFHIATTCFQCLVCSDKTYINIYTFMIIHCTMNKCFLLSLMHYKDVLKLRLMLQLLSFIKFLVCSFNGKESRSNPN